MSQGRPQAQPGEISLEPEEGWHCTHIYYEFDRAVLGALSDTAVAEGKQALTRLLDPEAEGAPARL